MRLVSCLLASRVILAKSQPSFQASAWQNNTIIRVERPTHLLCIYLGMYSTARRRFASTSAKKSSTQSSPYLAISSWLSLRLVAFLPVFSLNCRVQLPPQEVPTPYNAVSPKFKGTLGAFLLLTAPSLIVFPHLRQDCCLVFVRLNLHAVSHDRHYVVEACLVVQDAESSCGLDRRLWRCCKKATVVSGME